MPDASSYSKQNALTVCDPPDFSFILDRGRLSRSRGKKTDLQTAANAPARPIRMLPVPAARPDLGTPTSLSSRGKLPVLAFLQNHSTPEQTFWIPPASYPRKLLYSSLPAQLIMGPKSGNGITSSGRPRRRAVEACSFCRRRKVCHSQVHSDVDMSNCLPDQVQ